MTPDQMATTVTAARTAADVFGPYGGNPREAKRTYRIYAAGLHPDRTGASGLDKTVATNAFRRLTDLYSHWTATDCSPGDAGTPSDAFIVVGSAGTYTADGSPTDGTVSAVYAGTSSTGERVAVKVPRSPSSNRFIDAERVALTKLENLTSTQGNEWLKPYFPQLVDTVESGSGTDGRKIDILSPLFRHDGYTTLAAIQSALPQGLDGRDWAWIYRRLLRAVAGAHMAGVVHGAIVPENVLIHPEGHGVVLVGWSLSAAPGDKVPGRVASRKDHYPPDPDEPASTAFDVYMLNSLMWSMLAADEIGQRRFATGCMQSSPRMRPSAKDLLGEYDSLLEHLYGRRRFREFPYKVETR